MPIVVFYIFNAFVLHIAGVAMASELSNRAVGAMQGSQWDQKDAWMRSLLFYSLWKYFARFALFLVSSIQIRVLAAYPPIFKTKQKSGIVSKITVPKHEILVWHAVLLNIWMFIVKSVCTLREWLWGMCILHKIKGCGKRGEKLAYG